MSTLKDLTGMKFHNLTIIKRLPNTSDGSAMWECLCDCGNISIVNRVYLLSGGHRSCGCLYGESNLKNKKSYKNNRHSDRKGVTYNENEDKWVARLTYRWVAYELGYHYKYDDAVAARVRAENEVKQYGKVITYDSCRVIKK